ncbi:MAG: hypothetical protein IJU91_08270 [Selenomonadaceae bacterium]|nr:hypothetical protein [Selenomonadaceae bacterium]
MENFKAFLEFLKNFFNVTKTESSTSFGESITKFFTVTVKAITLTTTAILMAILGVVMYFFEIWLASWVCGKIFDNFDNVSYLFSQREILAVIGLLFIKFLVYYFVALSVANSDFGALTILLILALLVLLVGTEIYECYNQSRDALDRAVSIGVYLTESFNEVLQIVTLVLAIGSSSRR